MAYPPAVEQWRPLVTKYFPPHLVDKALYVIMGESGGNPRAVGDGGVARGLFQIQDNRAFPDRPNAAFLDDPENNIRYAAQALGAAGGDWRPWGEGVLHNGKPFGALGNAPYRGGNMSFPDDPSYPTGLSDNTPANGPSPSGGLPQGWSTVTVGGKTFIINEYGEAVGSVMAGDPSAIDHFFDVSGNTAASIAQGDRQFNSISAYQQAVLAAQKEKDAMDNAIAQGNLDLARLHEQNYNHWQGVAAQAQRDATAVTARGQDLNFQTAQAQIAQAKYNSDQSFQVAMANATTDAQRNAITAQWNAEQAAIAKMQDETARVLGGQQNQTSQFGAETTRASELGRLQLDQNKFIADMASGARGADLFSLYFMQRGVAPDFNTMAAGGTPAQGAAMAPGDVMGAYKPVTAAPTFAGTPANQSASAVGQASAAGVAAATAPNPFIGPSTAQAPPPMQAPAPFKPTEAAPQYNDVNPEGSKLKNGIPLSALRPGLNLATHGGDGVWQSDYVPAYYDQGKTRPVKPGDTITDGMKLWVDYQPTRMAAGGYTTDRQLMVGDAPHTDPFFGGARPEIIDNPTGAPISVTPPPYIHDIARYGPGARQGRMGAVGTKPSYRLTAPIDRAATAGAPDPEEARRGAPMHTMGNQPVDMGPVRQSPDWRRILADRFARFGAARGQFPAIDSLMGALPRYALGTGAVQQQYQQAGMGDSYIQSSNNQYAYGQSEPMPNRLAMLARYGFPVTPGLYSATTGGTLPRNNLGGAFTMGRQAGVLPSLQTLNSMSPGETELYKGYAEGVAKVPWRDLISYLGQATQNLKGAQRARVA